MEKEVVEENKKREKITKLIILILSVILVVIVIAIVVLVFIIPRTKVTCVDFPYGSEVDKPIIYLYPTEETVVEVKLGYPEKLFCSYPKYENSWNVLAKPDGKLVDLKTGRNLYSLYWEGHGTANYDFKEGFVVKGSDIAKFLEEKLSILGLNEYEAEEFIVYWLPKMQNNKYNFIRFATQDEINEYMPLEFSTTPDTLIRVLMQYKKLESPIEVKAQELSPVQRDGFVVVEWGGSEIK